MKHRRVTTASRVRARTLRAAAVAVPVAATAALAVTTGVVPAGASAASEGPSLGEVRRTVLEATNAMREAEGEDPLALRSELSTVAQDWSESMASTSTLAHDPTYGRSIPRGWDVAVENVANGYAPGDVVGAWADSPEHRANLLAPATDLGVGFATDDQGVTWFTVVVAGY